MQGGVCSAAHITKNDKGTRLKGSRSYGVARKRSVTVVFEAGRSIQG
jgi:hypothetical protein